MSRIASQFTALRAAGRVGLIPYVTAGFPDLSATEALIPALVEAGGDLIEIGVPFSDPLADGATIQRASHHALEQGVTLGHCLDLVERVRAAGVTVPLIFMSYYNPVLRYGLDRFAARAAAVGLDGLIVPDLPPEESDDLRLACRARDLDLVFLLPPTSTEDRIQRIASLSTGFVYCVSLTGVTGARRSLSDTVPELVARVRRHTDRPIAVGFGISRPEHVAAVGRVADAAVVGSALVDVIERADRPQLIADVQRYLRSLRAPLAI
ncbi:MAG: tryptophan synthase subunit alpha [Chloroflexi bacterium]|nr:tryptophan synthase subunit alpha [Chloroflexota bacterium]